MSDRPAVIVVDHGSRIPESNRLLEEMAELFAAHSDHPVVEPAHMELAEPSIAAAFDRCVARGATTIVIQPFFLLPGRHWEKDIPRLAAQAARRHPRVRYLVSAPLGPHPLLARIMAERVRHCMACARGDAEPCDVCAGRGACEFAAGGP
jgi:sirohydrochlorin ferrochelatase